MKIQNLVLNVITSLLDNIEKEDYSLMEEDYSNVITIHKDIYNMYEDIINKPLNEK